MAIYKLEFLFSATEEMEEAAGWNKEQFAKKLRERLDHPRVPSAKLRDLRAIVVIVIAVGRRDGDERIGWRRRGSRCASLRELRCFC